MSDWNYEIEGEELTVRANSSYWAVWWARYLQGDDEGREDVCYEVFLDGEIDEQTMVDVKKLLEEGLQSGEFSFSRVPENDG